MSERAVARPDGSRQDRKGHVQGRRRLAPKGTERVQDQECIAR
jgi:hypothetical protein